MPVTKQSATCSAGILESVAPVSRSKNSASGWQAASSPLLCSPVRAQAQRIEFVLALCGLNAQETHSLVHDARGRILGAETATPVVPSNRGLTASIAKILNLYVDDPAR